MPTDLTGTPTSLGIGTYNVDADAPSGLGFNAAMAQIDALIAARVSKPAGIVSGEAVVWNGTGWDRSSVTRISPSSLGSGTPDATQFLRGDGAWAAVSGAPTGALLMYGVAAAPTGWVLADGSAILRTGANAALFALYGTTYGVGDGSTTFNVPDMRGRVAVGYAAAGGHADVSTLGANDGVAASFRRPKHRHTPHTHTMPYSNTAGTVSSLATGANINPGGPVSTSVDGGSGNANDSLDAPAYIVVNYIIKL